MITSENCKKLYDRLVPDEYLREGDVNNNTYISDIELFPITIAFCEIYNQKCSQELQYVIDYLKAMQRNPEKFQAEWRLWEMVIADVMTKHKYICSSFFWSWLIRLPHYLECDSDERKEESRNLVRSQDVIHNQNKVAIVGAPYYTRNIVTVQIPLLRRVI